MNDPKGKKQCVENACQAICERFDGLLDVVYRDIEIACVSQGNQTISSFVLMQEKIKVSELISQQMHQMRTDFVGALRNVADAQGQRVYTDSQLTFMWQAVAPQIALPTIGFVEMYTSTQEGGKRAYAEKFAPKMHKERLWKKLLCQIKAVLYKIYLGNAKDRISEPTAF